MIIAIKENPAEGYQNQLHLSYSAYAENLNVPVDKVERWFRVKNFPPVWIQNLLVDKITGVNGVC